MPEKRAPFERFQERYVIDANSGCWLWTGQTHNGYGTIKVFGRQLGAHVLSHELYHGPVPDGLEVLHSCNNKACVNPAHLRAATHTENMKDAWRDGLILLSKGRPSPRRGIKSNQAHPVRVLGQVYGSKKEAERCLGLGSGTVLYWIKSKPQNAQPISREEYFDGLS